MIRRARFVLAAAALATIAMPGVPALAGGGCHAGSTTGAGDTVEMRDACFTPTSLRIEPGATVTFVNRDPLTHNVGGTGWGNLDGMTEGDAFTATFADPGVYPYACSYHPGMTGVIVVGTGTGAGNGEEVDVASFVADESAPPTALAAAPAPADPGPGALGWIAVGAAGLAIGVGVGLYARRRSGGLRTGA
jgi:plastocyanin